MVASDAEPTTYPLRTQTHTGNLGALTTRVLKVSGSPHLKAPRFQLLTCIVISQVHASERDPAVIAAAEAAAAACVARGGTTKEAFLAMTEASQKVDPLPLCPTAATRS